MVTGGLCDRHGQAKRGDNRCNTSAYKCRTKASILCVYVRRRRFLSSHISHPIPQSFNNPAHLKYVLAVPPFWRRRRDNQNLVRLAR